MFHSMPTVLSQTGIDFHVQFVEIVDNYVLIRVRCDDMRPSGPHGIERPVVTDEWFTLSDAGGHSVELLQISAAGSGPFAGIVDLAFPVSSDIDFDAPITLTAEHAQVVLQLERRVVRTDHLPA
jgi:hypothetical protein